jgi:hypothetical protein
MRAILLVCIALFAFDAYGQWIDHATGTVLPDTKSRKSMRNTGASLVLTSNAASFIEEWKNTPESNAPRIPPLGLVKRGDSVWVLLFFTGCGTKGPPCEAMVDYTILKPDGSVYGQVPSNRVTTQTSAKSRIIYLSQAYLQIRIEPQDPLGKYRVLARFSEPSENSTVELQNEFEVSQ